MLRTPLAKPDARIQETKTVSYAQKAMQKNILITGKPKSGKSTLLRRLITDIPNTVGFVTNEILGEHGRVGFEMETHTGSKAILAHTNFKTQYQVSKYFVDIDNLNSLIPEVYNFGKHDFLYLDEIGQMQLFSDKFKELAMHYLDSSNACLATLSHVFENDFTNSLKKREDVILIELSSGDRDEKEKFLTDYLNDNHLMGPEM